MYNNFVSSFFEKEVCIVKSMKLIISLASALIVLTAAVCAVVIFQEELAKLYRTCCDYCKKAIQETKDEYADFADV